MSKAENAEEYIGKHTQWNKELQSLRNLINSYKLEESIK